MQHSNRPKFSFEPPIGYDWLINHQLVGFEAGTALQPWHYLPDKHAFEVTERWPSGSAQHSLFAFAKRQDTDDLACFEIREGHVARVFLVHGWTANGYEISKEFSSFWEWLKFVIDEIADWAEAE